MLSIIETRTGNIRSVINAFNKLGVDTKVISDPKGLAVATAIVLPGVGAFEHAMEHLNETGMADALRRRSADNVPILGICLGMQLLGDYSEEHGKHNGLGLIPGKIIRLPDTDGPCRVPNIGWHETTPTGNGRLFTGRPTASFYYVHSYYFVCETPAHGAATFDYCGVTVNGAVERGNVYGVQFHPEKSQDDGLDLLSAFIEKIQI
ncbi:MAG TPA: imidazole glycerol phosphate synthase subunit HisH [Rhodospirillales bacterium]|nr:imidazole glycerol phosphate synthase subunit HisH [Rhodospirillales bacterium]